MGNAGEALNRLGLRLESWRAEYSAPTPIPPDIWKKAAELAAQLGVTRVSKALRLDYSRLKRLGAGEDSMRADVPFVAQPSFIELRPVTPEPLGRCVIEVESARGARMRLQLDNPDCASLAALVREFAGG